MFKTTRQKIILALGVVLGALLILGIRFARYQPAKQTHYHANFAVYINGNQEQLSNPLIYEEISECTPSTVKKPSERVHLHDQIKDVVHVEDQAVTWGNFFQNISWNVGTSYLDTSDTLLSNNDTNKVTFILNGKIEDDISRKVIGDKDRLLVTYGNSTQDELDKQFATVASTAEKYDIIKDPASCSGSHSKNSMSDRMKHLF